MNYSNHADTAIPSTINNVHDIATAFSRIFAGRKDCYGSLKGACIRKSIESTHLENHLNGIESLGCYPLLDNGTCHWAVIDFDFKSDENRVQVAEEHSKEFAEELKKYGIKDVWFERSKSSLVHLWIFFSKPVEARKIRKVLACIADKLGLKVSNGSVEIFPKQDQLQEGQVGNYVHLPYFNGLNNNSLKTRAMLDPETFEHIPLYEFIERAKGSFIHPEVIDAAFQQVVKNESIPSDGTDLNSLNSYPDTKSIIEIIKPYWNEGQRQELSLCLTGFLSKQGLSWDRIEQVINKLCLSTGDTETRQRLASIKTTYNRVNNGNDVKGYSGLSDMLHPDDLGKLNNIFRPKRIEINYPNPLNEKAYYGLAGEVVKLILPHSEADPVALLINFLTCFGNIVGNTPHFKIGADKHTMRLFSVLVGESAKARKGHSYGFIEHIFKATDEDWENRSQSGLSTGEGLIWAVRDQIVKKRPVKEKGTGRILDYEDVIEDEGVKDKRLLVLESEFASVLKVANREGNILSPVVRQAWDKGNLRTLTKNSPSKASDTHISILAHITREELLRYLNKTETSNGFANRFLWLCVKRSNILPFGGDFDKVNTAPLILKLRQAIEFASSVERITWAEETKPLWGKIYPTLSEGRAGLIGSLTARAEAYVTRIACIYALLDMSQEIRIEHLEAALALWDYNEASIKYIFQNKIGDPLAEKILQLLSENQNGLSKTDISNSLGRNYSADQISTSLSILESLGYVTTLLVKTEGRPKEIWKLI